VKAEAVPFFSILVGLVFALAWFISRYEMYRFKDPDTRQFCAPSITEGTQRLGRDVAWLEPEAIQPGDLVRFKTARTGGKEATSRVVALAGQRVAVDEGKLLIDGQEVTDPHARRGNAADWSPEVMVPEGCVYVINDLRWGNGSERLDSRTIGPIPVHAIEYVFSPKDDAPKGGR
jgi:signal peptidase I